METVPQLGSLYVYKGILLQGHDGDTAKLRLDRGYGDFKEGPYRLDGCNANEMKDPGGPEARNNLIEELIRVPWFYVRSKKPDRPPDPYKYGAVWMARIFLPDGTDLVDKLIAEQWLAKWNGTGTPPKPPWPRTVQ